MFSGNSQCWSSSSSAPEKHFKVMIFFGSIILEQNLRACRIHQLNGVSEYVLTLVIQCSYFAWGQIAKMNTIQQKMWLDFPHQFRLWANLTRQKSVAIAANFSDKQHDYKNNKKYLINKYKMFPNVCLRKPTKIALDAFLQLILSHFLGIIEQSLVFLSFLQFWAIWNKWKMQLICLTAKYFFKDIL